LTATVGAGVITADIKKAAARYGLFYPPDPASFAYTTIGGNIATDSGGLQCVKYGTTRSYVAGLEVVLANGEIIHTGNKCIKDVAGYNLTQLFAGSEGTLGIITEAILKLVPVPEGKKAMMAIFSDLESAGRAVSKIMVAGVVPSTMELLENTIIRCVEDVIHQNLPVDAAALLLIEVDGDAATLDGKIEKISAVCKELGVSELRFANTAEEINQIWEGRRNCMLAVSRFGKRISGDPAAPINRLPEELLKLRELGEKYNVKTACYGHAGDGNLHPLFFYTNDEEFERATKVKDDFYDFMLTLGGTVTAEHGIGNEKIKYMKKQFGPVMYGIMKGIKKVLDPKNILSPGCLFGEDL
ncbi:MAG: FAD-binding protein, partial [Desulfovibrio sp.]|nr:FAD-binding protein [Desulfovibrio sp.]